MLKSRHLMVSVAAALGLAACASDPVTYSQPVYSSAPTYYAPAAYSETGRVVAIDVVRTSGRTSGGGAVAGAIIGGVIGHQIGSGRGNDVATAAGAVGGAVVGNNIERNRNDDEYYRVVVELRDGRQATYTQESLDGLRVGDRVRVSENHVYRD